MMGDLQFRAIDQPIPTVVIVLAYGLLFLIVLAFRRGRALGRLRTGAALLFVEGCLVTVIAIALFPMLGFAGVGDGGEHAVMVAMIIDGLLVATGLFWIVMSALAMRGDRRACWFGVVLSGLCAGVGFLSQGDSLELFPRIGLTVVLALPAIYLLLGLRGSRAQPVRPLETVKRVDE